MRPWYRKPERSKATVSTPAASACCAIARPTAEAADFFSFGTNDLTQRAFGFSRDAFEAQLRRMSGLEDGITDGLYRMSRPITGGYYWCPPLKDGRLDLRALRVG